jgi:hypothetical protein
MKQYRITVTEIGGNDGSVVGNETTNTDIFTQIVGETELSLRSLINAINTKPRVRTRNRKQTLVGAVTRVEAAK